MHKLIGRRRFKEEDRTILISALKDVAHVMNVEGIGHYLLEFNAHISIEKYLSSQGESTRVSFAKWLRSSSSMSHTFWIQTKREWRPRDSQNCKSRREAGQRHIFMHLMFYHTPLTALGNLSTARATSFGLFVSEYTTYPLRNTRMTALGSLILHTSPGIALARARHRSVIATDLRSGQLSQLCCCTLPRPRHRGHGTTLSGPLTCKFVTVPCPSHFGHIMSCFLTIARRVMEHHRDSLVH